MAALTAVLLAGGRGSRLEPLTENLPKPLVLIDDQPVVEILIRQLHRGGVTKFILAVGHRAEQIKDHLQDGSRFGVKIEYSTEPSPLSTIAPLKLIRDLPERFIVANADILTDLNVADLYESHMASKALLTVAAVKRTARTDYGVLDLSNDSFVTGFSEKPSQELTVSTGIYVFERKLLEFVPDGQSFGFDQLMTRLLSEKQPINCWLHDGYWQDIGRPVDYLKAHRDIDRIRHLLS